MSERYETLCSFIDHWADLHPNNLVFTFLTDGEDKAEDLSYSTLNQQVQNLAFLLHSNGIKPNDRVILIYPPSLSFLIAFLGCLYLGVIAVPIYPPRVRKGDLTTLKSIIADAASSVALTTESLLETLQPSLETDPDLQGFQLVATDQAAFLNGRMPPASISADDLAYLQYTSGSTGSPKGVMISHRNLMENLAFIRDRFTLSSSSVGLHWLPPYHDMGLVGGILSTLHNGAYSILMPPIYFIQKPLRWLKAVSTYRATVSGGPNFAYELCATKITPAQRQGLDLSSWTVAFNGAEPIRASTLERFATAFAPNGFKSEAFLPCYGLAEGTLMVTCRAGAHVPVVGAHFDDTTPVSEQLSTPLVSSGSLSHAMMDIRIVSPETFLPVPDGDTGEIWLSGPSVARGYWGQPQQTDATFNARMVGDSKHAFLRTGDMGFVQSGELYITGRMKEMLIIRGRNYCPQDIESVVQLADPLLNLDSCAVFSVEKNGEERLVVVQEIGRRHARDDDMDGVFTTIRRCITETFELRVHAIVLIRSRSLPKTANGKIQRYACRQSFLENTLDVIAQWQEPVDERNAIDDLQELIPLDGSDSARLIDSQNAIRTWLVARLSQELVLSPSDIDPATPFAEYGLDSLQQATLLGELSEHFEYPNSFDLFEAYPTIESLAGYLSVLKDIQMNLQALPIEQRRTVLMHLADSRSMHVFESQEDIPQRCYQFDHFPEFLALEHRRKELLSADMPNPYFTQITDVRDHHIIVDGQEFINYSGNNYLGLSAGVRTHLLKSHLIGVGCNSH
ncbi:MAG: hypothetical protein ETSY1_28805, partial [Candidatus Entotheonella factor]